MKRILILFLTLLPAALFANNAVIDSISRLLQQESDPKREILLQCQLGQNYTEIGEFQRGGELANSALVAAREMEYEFGEATAYYSLGRLHQYMNDWNKALMYHYKAIPIFEKLAAFEELAWTYLNMGIAFHAQKNYEKALEHEYKAIDVFKKAKNRQGEAYSLLNISLAINELGYHDSAFVFMNEAKDICVEIKDLRGVGYVLNSMAEIYERMGEFEKAIEGNLECIKIRKQENDKMDLSFCYSNLGSIYLKMGQPDRSKAYLDQAEELATDIDAKAVLRTIYLYKSKIDSMNGHYSSAYMNFKRFAHYQDLLSNEENQKKAAELQHQFEKAQQDQEIEMIKKEQAIQNEVNVQERKMMTIGIVALIFGLFLVGAFSVSLYKRANQMKKQRNIIVKQKERVDEAHKSIKDSIVYAQKIQQALLTGTEYIQTHLNKEFFIYYQPKDIVSGDFYWATEHNDEFYLVTADCTGHGVPGAFMSLLNISKLTELILERELSSPANILNEQRRLIIEALSGRNDQNSQDGMDCVLCKFNADKTKVTFAAANNSLWIIRNKEVLRFKGDKMPVGKYMEEEHDFTEQTVDLLPGDMVYTFTDGITDQFGGPDDKKFKPRRLEELLLEVHQLPMDEQELIIMRNMEEWMGNTEQTDDILMIGVRC